MIAVLLTGLAGWQILDQTSSHRRLPRLRHLFQDSQFAQALQLGRDILHDHPAHQEVLAITGLAASATGERELAQEYLCQLEIQRTDLRPVYDGWLKSADLHQQAGHLEDAWEILQAVFRIDSTDVLVIRRMAQIRLGIGDQEAAAELLQRLVDLGHASPRELMTLAAGATDLWGEDRIASLRQRAPQDRLLIEAAARQLVRHKQTDAALQLLDEVLQDNPDEPHLLLLRLEVSTDGVENWSALTRLPDSARLWLFLADQVDSVNVIRGAAYVRRALQRRPFDLQTNSEHARRLSRQGAEHEARDYLERAQQLRELTELCSRRDVFGSPRAQRCVDLLSAMGRTEEAIAWCRAERRISSDSEWAADELTALLQIQRGDASRSKPPVDPESDLHMMAVDELLERRHGAQRTAGRSATAAEASRIQFQDVAHDSGLNVLFYNGAQATEQGRRMHEFSGGGVGVLDLDGDDWPDLMFPQGSDDPAGRQPSTVTDQLFRNLRGTSFRDVSEVAGLGDTDFGQGVAIGDVNNDGFDDIYVANTARNTLWLNQGDGTFLRHEPDSDDGVWTISAAIADIDRDSIPDLYDVNYVGGDQAFRLVCDHDGEERVCGPTDFPAEQDVVWSGTEDGSYHRTLRATDAMPPESRGMGIVVGDLLGDGDTQLLIANDESANAFLERDDGGQWRDTAVLRGIAFGSAGTRQGSMGIAAGHVTSRQRTDLFITNYYGESNCLHMQTDDGFFPDMVAPSRLDQPGRRMLGFGTQFLDADSDGDDDLFVANGHLDDFRFLQVPYFMRPQLFENTDGVFTEHSAVAASYLSTPVLGRAVARLDWNRDGRMDLCITHLDRPVALLQNQTPPAQRSLLLSYVGTTQSRDAVGTTLTVQQADNGTSESDQPSVYPILAGDGYACSNERLLHLVIDPETQQVIIHDGQQPVTIPVHDGAPLHWKLVEGHPQAWPIPR